MAVGQGAELERGVAGHCCKQLRANCMEGAQFLMRGVGGDLEKLKFLKGLIIDENHTNPRKRQERLRGVDPAWHCKGGKGGAASKSPTALPFTPFRIPCLAREH